VPLAFHQILCFQAFANLSFSSLVLVLQKLYGRQQQQTPCQRRGRREPHWRSPEAVIIGFFTALYRFLFVSDDPLCVSRLIQWNPAPAPATTPAMVGDSSGSSGRSHSSSSRYDDLAARRFKVERDETFASWRSSPKRPESPSSSGSTSASSCWRPSTMNPVICLISTQL
jgi:hypothetical protein